MGSFVSDSLFFTGPVLHVDAAENVDHILGQTFHYVAYGVSRGFGIAGYLLPGGRAEEYEEIAGRECGGAGGIGWNRHDDHRGRRKIRNWNWCGNWSRCHFYPLGLCRRAVVPGPGDRVIAG